MLRKPCDACPFTKGPNAVRLTAGRVRELAKNALSTSGGSFPCHKTTVEVGDGELGYGRKTVECAGSLLFAHKQGRYNQYARILGRIGMFRPDEMDASDVFDSTADMLKTAVVRRRIEKLEDAQ